MTFEIDKNVPLPPNAGKPGGGKYPWASMEIGDSFFAPGKVGARVATAGKRGGGQSKFTIRTVTENGVRGVRVWRIA
jgi:hypothetical protein